MRTLTGLLAVAALGAAIAGTAAGQTVAMRPEERAELVRLQSAKPDVRRDAAEKLGDLRSTGAAPELVKSATGDPDASVRSAAILALGEIGDRSLVDQMAPVLKDSNEKVRGAAVEALVNVYLDQEKGFFSSVKHVAVVATPFWDEHQTATVEPYDPVSPAATSGIAELLKTDTSHDNRVAAVRALGALRANDQIDGLADAMGSDPKLRSEVLNAFVLIGDPAAARYAIPLFESDNGDVAAEAMYTAGRLRANDAVTPLLTVYGSGGPKTGVVGAVKNPFPPNRRKAALQSLALIGAPAGHQAFLDNVYNKDTDWRRAAFEGIAREDDPQLLNLVSRSAQTEKNDSVRLAQTFALYMMGRPGMMSVIVQAVSNRSQRDQAAQYIREAKTALDILPFIRTPDPDAQVIVVDALGNLGDQGTADALRPLVRGASPELALAADRSIRRIEWRIANPNAGGEKPPAAEPANQPAPTAQPGAEPASPPAELPGPTPAPTPDQPDTSKPPVAAGR